MARTLISRAPKLQSQLLWEAFWDLRSMAPNGMGYGLIPIDKMHWYADVELEFNQEETRAFVWIMRRVDGHYVSLMNDKANKTSK